MCHIIKFKSTLTTVIYILFWQYTLQKWILISNKFNLMNYFRFKHHLIFFLFIMIILLLSLAKCLVKSEVPSKDQCCDKLAGQAYRTPQLWWLTSTKHQQNDDWQENRNTRGKICLNATFKINSTQTALTLNLVLCHENQPSYGRDFAVT